MRTASIFAFILLALGTAKAQFPNGFAAISIADQLDPTAMTLAPNGDLFLAEKNGRVSIIRNGQVLPQPFLELAVDNYNERGLSGIAVHPNFPTTPFVYLYYSVPGANHNRIVRVPAANDQALTDSMETLLDLDPLNGTIHNGGAMLFGPDGMLYVAVGDGAGFDVAQSLQSFSGKILRVNPDGSVPADNPFYQQTSGNYRAIWAIRSRSRYKQARGKWPSVMWAAINLRKSTSLKKEKTTGGQLWKALGRGAVIRRRIIRTRFMPITMPWVAA